MFEIKKEFHFSASHQLDGLPEDHQCARLHGHNYILTIHLKSDGLDYVGFVVDYGELNFVKAFVDSMDHRHLNDLFNFNPTSEHLARYATLYFARCIADIKPSHRIDEIAVTISETPKTTATYSSPMSRALYEMRLAADAVGE